MQGRRVAVTGIGVVARAGIGADAYWDGLLAEAPVGWRQIEDWDPSPYFDNPKDARRSDPCTQYALAAAQPGAIALLFLGAVVTLLFASGRRDRWVLVQGVAGVVLGCHLLFEVMV